MIRIFNNKILSSKKIIQKRIWAAILLGVIGLAFLINPTDTNFITCQFKELTGHSCPTCGMSRSIHSASHLQIIDSILFHPIGTILFFGFIILFFKFSFEAVTKNEIQFKVDGFLIKIFCISIVIFWIWFWIIRLIFE